MESSYGLKAKTHLDMAAAEAKARDLLAGEARRRLARVIEAMSSVAD